MLELILLSAIRTTDVSDICSTPTSLIRNVPHSVKRQIYVRDGIPGGNYTGICSGDEGCEVDHRISLELGGSNDASNLMIQPYDGVCNAHDKDQLENKLHKLVCDDKLDIHQAQNMIFNDWVSAYRNYVDKNGCGL